MRGNICIGCISDTDPQPIMVRSKLGLYAVCSIGIIQNAKALSEELLENGCANFETMSSGNINSGGLIGALIAQKPTFVEGIRYAQSKGMFVMTDGKRNDIGATMTAYATAHLGKTEVDGVELEAFGADALTVNGYLGTDGIQPLLDVCEKYDKGIFVLAKTSNPSSGELQDRQIDGKPVYEIMGEMCESWGSKQIGAYGYSAVGAVVGATYPEQLAELRQKLPHTMFLVPGYGAQGGGAQGVAGAFDKNGRGAIVNSSRAIMCAWKKEGNCLETAFAEAARREAIRMRDDITAYL